MDLTTLELRTAPGSTIAAVLIHPHPDFGGDRFNHVVDAIYRTLPAAGASVARFDLSGAVPEQARADTLEAMDRIGAGRVALVGYSFGADVALGVDDGRVVGWFAVAPPLRFSGFSSVAIDSRPKALLCAELDQFSPPERAQEITSGWENTSVATIAGADHFLNGHSGAVAEAARRWVTGLGRGDSSL
jgi:alpha/beta superfamily hydrolase